MNGVQVASMFGVLELKDELSAGLEKAEKGMRGFGKSTIKTGQQITKFGAKLTLMTAPLALVGGWAIKTAIDWESAFAGVVKTVDGTSDELAQLEADLRSLATSADSPVSSLENAHLALAQIAEVAGQLGVPLDYIVAFTEQMGILAMATDLTAEDAATMTAVFANLTGMSWDNVDEFASTIVALGNNSAATESQILAFAERIAATGAAAGLAEWQILAWAAAMASSGLDPEAGGTSFTRIINDLLTFAAMGSGPELQAVADLLGVSATAMADMIANDPSTVLHDILTEMSGWTAMEKIDFLKKMGWDDVRINLFFQNMSTNIEGLDKALGIAETGWKENTAAMLEGEKRAETTQGKINKFKNSLNEFAIMLGDTVLPEITKLVEKLTEIVTNLSASNPELLKAGMLFIGIAVAAGPVVSIIGTMVTVFGGLAWAAGWLVKGLSLLAGVGWLPLAAGALTVAGGFLAFKNNVLGLGEDLGQLVDAIKEKDLLGVLGELVEILIKLPLGIPLAIADAIAELLGIDIQPFKDALGEIGQALSGALLERLEPWVDVGSTIGRLIKDALSAELSMLSDVVTKFVATFATFFSDNSGVVMGLIYGIGRNWLNGIAYPWKQMINNEWIRSNLIQPMQDILDEMWLEIRLKIIPELGGIPGADEIRDTGVLQGDAAQYLSNPAVGGGGGGDILDALSDALGGLFGGAGGGYNIGWGIVGEEGPELINFGSGARVYSNPDSQKMLGGGPQTIQIYLDGAVLFDATVNEANRRNLQLVVA